MKIGIVSPSKIDYIEEINPRAREILKRLAEKLAKENHEIVITPDKGSVSELFGEEYNTAKGKKIWEIIPLEELK